MLSDERKNKFGADRLSKRSDDELIGLARGLIADGIVNAREVEFLQAWFAFKENIVGNLHYDLLSNRINEILSDRDVSQEESVEVFELLSSIVGGSYELGEVAKSTTLPLCTPAPSVTYEGKSFCMTGTFAFGKRKLCEQEVSARNGRVVSSVTRDLSYLVIGTYATESWRHSSYGNKIIRAAEIRAEGHGLHIIHEDHWIRSMN
jgi:NAD-dependent DNA ligase